MSVNMSSMPIISVVIPCYNHGKYLREALASVEVYNNPNEYEIIIVNDGSTSPDTIQVLEQLTEEGYHILNQTNQGLGAARNNGIRMARGKYILPLDCDNRIRQVYIAKGIDILELNPEVGVVYGHVQLFGAKNEIYEVPLFDLEALIRRNYIDACAVFRKSVWEQVGGYDERMPVMGYEDWDFWLSVATAGYKFHRLEEVGFEYQVRDDSMLRVNSAYEKQRKIFAYILKKHSYLFDEKVLSEIYLERTLFYYEIETLKAKLAAARSDRYRLVQDNKTLCKILLKNMIRPFLKKAGLK